MESKYKKLTKLSILFILPIVLINCINTLIFKLANRNPRLSVKNGEYYNWRFGNIFYTKQGEGTPVLLIHELSSVGSAMEFNGLIHQLSKKHTVYALDLLGCGRSEKPAITYTAYIYVQLINDFIKDIIKTKTNVIVSGKSCSLVSMACCTEEHYYRNILMINPDNMAKGNQLPSPKNKLLKSILDCHTIGTLIYLMVHNKESIHTDMKKQFFTKNEHVLQRYLPYCYEASHRSGTASKYLYGSLATHYLDCNIVHAIKHINTSIYMAMGQNEPDKSNTIEQYQVLNPSIEASIIEDSTHFPHLEQPKEILSICDMLF